MMDKDYPHPLYSLDLRPHSAAPEDEPRQGILLPRGRLVVRAELRRRAEDHGVLDVDHLVGTVLAYHGAAEGAFARFGLGPEWAASMRHWRARMLEEDLVSMALAVARDRAVAAARAVVAEGRAAYGRLVLSARLAGLGERVARGAAPAAAMALPVALETAAARAAEPVHAALLARCGFGPEELGALRALAERIPRAAALRTAAEERCREQAAALLTVRAALLGDAARLCQVAPEALGAERGRRLRVAALLGRPNGRPDGQRTAAQP